MSLIDRPSYSHLNKPLRLRMILMLVLMLIAGCPLSAAGSHKSRAKKTVPYDASYAAALNAANRFLHAWQAGDLEAGMVLLSDHARHAQNPDRFEEFFSYGTERAYEISRGTGNRGRYRFPAVLVTTQGSRARRRFTEIVVVDTGRNEWAIDKLP